MTFGLRELLSCLVLIFVVDANAQNASPPPQTTLDLEWEAVEGSAGYELELIAKTPGAEPMRFKSEENSISQQVPAGIYKLRVRAKEAASRVYGVWSAATEIDASAKKIEYLFPEDQSELKAEKGNRLSVEFKWHSFPGAKFYTLHVWSGDRAKTKDFKTTQTSLKIQAEGSKKYNWYVTFETAGSVSYLSEINTAKIQSFIVKGPPLAKPVIEDITLPNLTRVSWKAVPQAEFSEVRIQRRNLDEAEWKSYLVKPETKGNSLDFPKLSPGAYRIEVTAHSPMRSDSETDFIEFVVKPTVTDLNDSLRATLSLLSREPGAKKP